MHFPKISIVTPNYNLGKYLEDTILSVISQNYPNLEYIIIDGGSTDNSVEIIKKYNKYLTYWISEPDHGLYDAIQKGFEKSTGEIMAWINSDDMYHPKSFFTIAEIFNTFSNVKWVTGSITGYDERGRTVSCNKPEKWSKFRFYENYFRWIQQESTFWHRDLWTKIGNKLDISLMYSGDFDLWLRFFRYECLYICNTLIGGFRHRTLNQLSNDHINDYYNEVSRILNDNVLTNDEKLILGKIQFYKKLLRITKLNRLLNHGGVQRRLNSKIMNLYNFPPEIVFNPLQQKFEFSYSYL